MNSRLVRKKYLYVIPIFLLGFFLNSGTILARENVNYWYIQDFQSEIRVNKDSSLDITEKITADCGNAAGKHGIFRILPEEVKLTTGGIIKSPVKLVSITDFNDNPINYTELKDSFDNTVTWKIGDPDRTVQGVNYYKIHYTVKNAIRFGNANFDEFYWNLNGNYWDLETDKFHAKIIFPEEVNKNNTQVDYYTGPVGSKLKNQASYQWTSDNILEFDSIGTLKIGDGITASATFQKNIFTPYVPGFWETYGKYFWLILPFAVFIYCFRSWWKYGKDPLVDKTVIAEYEAPGNLTPIEIGLLMKNGGWENGFLTAEIINLATKKLITIKETDEKILIFHSKDFELEKHSNPEVEKTLNDAQKSVLDNIFAYGNPVKLSSLKNEFYKNLPDIKDKSKKILENKKLISAYGLHYQTGFMVAGIILMFSTFFSAAVSVFLATNLFISGLILFIFSFVMPKRTPEGAELNWQIKGFKLFMETVDKDRAKFYEKENIFEKFLPYAIVFGITGLWIKKMKEIYGEEYFATHAPAWYIGTNMAAFNAESFETAMDSLSSNISQSTSSPSGSGGSGSSGGGGGGGGGGGW